MASQKAKTRKKRPKGTFTIFLCPSCTFTQKTRSDIPLPRGVTCPMCHIDMPIQGQEKK